MAYQTVLFEYGTQKVGYQKSDAPIGDQPLSPGVTYEVVFPAGITPLPPGWSQLAAQIMRLKPRDSPLYGVITEKCNIHYVRVDETRDDTGTTILGRTVTAQFEYIGTSNQSGLIRNIVRRIADWGDIYTLEMIPPGNRRQ